MSKLQLVDETMNWSNSNEKGLESWIRTLDKWIVLFAGQLQMIATVETSNIILNKNDFNMDDSESNVTSEDYKAGVLAAKKYFSEFDDEIFKKHHIEKNLNDFNALLSLDLQELQYMDSNLIEKYTW